MTAPDTYAAGVTQPTQTDTPPDPTEVGDATVDATTAGTAADPAEATAPVTGLSDEANAALYPDVDHPDPAQLPPDALQTPPPFAEHESALLDIIRMYATGQTDWPATKQALIAFDYANPPERDASPMGPTRGDWYADVEADIGTFAPENTWGQLQEAADAGMLTRDEFNQVLAARAARGTGQDDGQDSGGDAGGPDAKPDASQRTT